VYKIKGRNCYARLPSHPLNKEKIRLNSTDITQPVFVADSIYNGSIDIRVLDDAGPTEPAEIAYELGLWLSGLDAFISDFEHLFIERGKPEPSPRLWERGFRLVKAGLQRSSGLLHKLRLAEMQVDPANAARGHYVDLSQRLRRVFAINESLLASGGSKWNHWRELRNAFESELASAESFRQLQTSARNCGDEALPEAVLELFTSERVKIEEHAETCAVLRTFASLHRALTVVRRILRNDEPLKPTLLIFSFVHDQTQQLIVQINNRLSQLTDEESEFFISLDAAAYTASLEIKKAFSQELTGAVAVRPSQAVYARVEVALSLLSASFEEIIASFARLLDPSAHVSTLFSSFKTKLEQSLVLRSSLHTTLRAVQEAEASADKERVETMRNTLELFTHEAYHFLYYKDKETLDRFMEEIQLTSNPKDLVPILHRFGAYLETLLGQVSMRAVLAGHPFESA
jgi:hypothetical protein